MFSSVVPIALLIAGTVAQTPGPQSLIDRADFSKLRPCAQSCFFYRGGYTRDYLGQAMRCSLTSTLLSSVADNDCLCRTDLQLSAHLTISTCVLKSCSSNSNDMTSAWSAYDNYCTANGFVAAAVETDAPQNAGPTAGPGPGATVTRILPTSTSKTSNASRSAPLWTLLVSGIAPVCTHVHPQGFLCTSRIVACG